MVSPVRFWPSAPRPAGGLRTWLLNVDRTPGEQVVIRHPERSGESLELSGAKRFRGHNESGVAAFAIVCLHHCQILRQLLKYTPANRRCGGSKCSDVPISTRRTLR